jgi:hypothetical protein
MMVVGVFFKTVRAFLLVTMVISVCLWAQGSLGLEVFLTVLGLSLGTADYLNGIPSQIKDAK